LRDFTTGSVCTKLTVEIQSSDKTQLLLSMHHSKEDRVQDAVAVWAEKSDAASDYRACVVEMRLNTGMHSGLIVVWLRLDYKERSQIKLSTPYDDGQYCMEKFYAEELERIHFHTIMKTVPAAVFGGEYSKNAYTVWTENKNDTSSRVCYEDIQGKGLDSASRVNSFSLSKSGTSTCDTAASSPCQLGINSVCDDQLGSFYYGSEQCRCRAGYVEEGESCQIDSG